MGESQVVWETLSYGLAGQMVRHHREGANCGVGLSFCIAHALALPGRLGYQVYVLQHHGFAVPSTDKVSLVFLFLKGFSQAHGHQGAEEHWKFCCYNMLYFWRMTSLSVRMLGCMLVSSPFATFLHNPCGHPVDSRYPHQTLG